MLKGRLKALKRQDVFINIMPGHGNVTSVIYNQQEDSRLQLHGTLGKGPKSLIMVLGRRGGAVTCLLVAFYNVSWVAGFDYTLKGGEVSLPWDPRGPQVSSSGSGVM